MNAKTILSSMFIFATGAAIGSVVTWKILDAKYKRLVTEEIESVVDAFSRDVTRDENSYEAPTASEVVVNNEYEALLASINKNDDKEVDDVTEPYVISPDEYDEIEDYDTETLFYYKDGVLTDDQDNPIENVDDMVGRDSLERFGEFEEDCVFVRNDKLKTDFEILRDPGRFSDVTHGPLFAEE